MATREIQIDGVTGNPIGGSVVGSTGGTIVQDSYKVASSALNQGYTTSTTGYAVGTPGYTYSSSTPGYSTSQNYTTTQYVQQPTTTTTYATGPAYTTTQYVSAPATTTTYIANQAPQVVNTVVNTGKEVIKGESRIEYVPLKTKLLNTEMKLRLKENQKLEKSLNTEKKSESNKFQEKLQSPITMPLNI